MSINQALRKEYICEGTFGILYKEYCYVRNKHIAAKYINKRLHQPQHKINKIAQMVDREIAAWTRLTESEAIYNNKLLNVKRTNDNTILYSDFHENNRISDRLNTFLLLEQVSIIKDIAKGIKECHDLDICHGDIKFQNTLFDTSSNKFILTDYGNSDFCSSYTTGLKNRRGTMYYMAPEIVLKDYGKAADVWALGIFAYRLFTYGDHPFFKSDNMEFKNAANQILNADIVMPDNMCTRLITDFLEKTLMRDPLDRLDIYEVLSHPLLKL